MNNVFSNDPIVAIDIGTTKICVLVARKKADNQLEIYGVGKVPSDGLKKGIVIDIAKTVQSLKNAIAQAELMAGCKIESATIGISGSHIQSLNSHGLIPLKRSEVKNRDVENVIASAQAIPLAEGQQVLHVLPQYFIVDSQARVADPVGMHGIRLEAEVHIITGSIACVQNLLKCCSMAGITVNDVVLEQIASALAVLSPDERRLGIGMLDIGGGTTDVALYHNGAIFYTMVLPVAGNQFTNDIALGLRTTIAEAERIKKEFGTIKGNVSQQDTAILVESVEGEASKHILADELQFILHARAQELLKIINTELMRYDLKPFIPAGFVLTGGGSLLDGMMQEAIKSLGMPVRIGSPRINKLVLESLDNPMYATGYGLLLHQLTMDTNTQNSALPIMARITDRMKSWIADLF